MRRITFFATKGDDDFTVIVQYDIDLDGKHIRQLEKIRVRGEEMSDLQKCEIELVKYLIDNYELDNDTILAIVLVCHHENIAKKMLEYCKKHKATASDDLFEKAVEIAGLMPSEMSVFKQGEVKPINSACTENYLYVYATKGGDDFTILERYDLIREKEKIAQLEKIRVRGEEMSELTENQKKLAKYLVEKFNPQGHERDVYIGIGVVCKTDEHAKKLLEYSQENPSADIYDLLAKAVEIAGLKPLEFRIVD